MDQNGIVAYSCTCTCTNKSKVLALPVDFGQQYCSRFS